MIFSCFSRAFKTPSNIPVTMALTEAPQDSKYPGLGFKAPSPFENIEDFIYVMVFMITNYYYIISTCFIQ
jgi:hypothetical protein